MSDIAISIDKLSKQYKIGTRAARHDTLRDQIAASLKSLWHHNGSRSPKPLEDTFWALQQVSFDVQAGEVVGIIGRNGAGKSTLLKILSRITPPTSGRVDIHGRVASLLEVGTGFHAELTGRENIYLNGAILGMKRAEIEDKFDEIVAFSEIEKFLDTPVKRYSSGMYVRLAFAVAAHLQPEILIVDEVLAVGDAGFQKKCLGKMHGVANEGRTVLFVSHNVGAVRNLCSRVFLLKDGRIQFSGDADYVIEKYLAMVNNQETHETILANRQDRIGSGNVRAISFEARARFDDRSSPRTGLAAEFIIGYSSKQAKPLSRLTVGITVSDVFGANLLAFGTTMTNTSFKNVAPCGQISCSVRTLPLIPGTYWVGISLKDSHGLADYISRAVGFTVVDGGDSGFSQLPSSEWGSVIIPHEWNLLSSEQRN